MPCYCDTPDESNQVEIEKRCKREMYFHATGILKKENLIKAAQLGIEICQFPLPDPNTALCNICKVLSEEQMLRIPAYYYKIKWQHKNLWDWYQQHCKDDVQYMEKKE